MSDVNNSQPQELRGTSESASLALPAGAPAWITEELIRLTLKTWQPFYKKAQLTPADAVQMLIGVGRLLAVLGGRK